MGATPFTTTLARSRRFAKLSREIILGVPNPRIDQLMRHEGAAYYVGLFKAAELHGATHQAIMEFQVVAAKRLADIRGGRSLVKFYFRKNLEAVEDGMEDYKTDTGAMKISSAALTALDLLRYPQASGGIDNVTTVLADLGKKIDPVRPHRRDIRTLSRPIRSRHLASTSPTAHVREVVPSAPLAGHAPIAASRSGGGID